MEISRRIGMDVRVKDQGVSLMIMLPSRIHSFLPCCFFEKGTLLHMLDLLCRVQSAEQNAHMSAHGEQCASRGKNYQTSLISEFLAREAEISQKSHRTR